VLSIGTVALALYIQKANMRGKIRRVMKARLILAGVTIFFVSICILVIKN